MSDGMGERRPFLPDLIVTGTVVAVGTAVRSMLRSAGVIGRHAGSLARLAVDASSPSPSAATAQGVLRDEVLELWREVASVSWQESRRAIDELDARTRLGPPDAATTGRRGHRVKP